MAPFCSTSRSVLLCFFSILLFLFTAVFVETVAHAHSFSVRFLSHIMYYLNETSRLLLEQAKTGKDRARQLCMHATTSSTVFSYKCRHDSMMMMMMVMMMIVA